MSPPLRGSATALQRYARGFTLMEMIVAMMIFVMLITGIFAIANGSMELSSDLAYAQERALMRQNLVEFMRKSFRTLPGDADIELKVKNIGGNYLPTLAIYGGGTSFSPGPALPMEASMEVYAEERPGGYLRVGLRMLDADQTTTARQGKAVKATNGAELPLLDNVSRFEWQFYDGRTNQWQNVWKDRGRPLFAELNLKLDDGEEIRSVFWIPPIVRRAATGIPPPAPGAMNPDGTPAVGPGNPQPPPGGGVPPLPTIKP